MIDSSLLAVFGILKQIWVLSYFIYFEYKAMETLCYSERYQAYQIQEVPGEEDSICAYENLVDFNVFHICETDNGSIVERYVPLKYDINDIIELHVQGNNPLKY